MLEVPLASIGGSKISPSAVQALSRSSDLRDAEYIPPPPEDLQALLEDLVRFSARTDLTPVALATLAHAQFEVIHPFVDGNGRVGRALLQQLLVNRAGIEAPVPVSVPWSEDTDRYISGLRAFQDGDVDSWLMFASWSVIEAVRWMSEMTGGVEELLDRMRGRIETRGRSVAVKVIDDLPLHPVVDTQTVAERYDVAPRQPTRLSFVYPKLRSL